MTIGDVLAVIAAVMLTAASWMATLLLTNLLFPEASARARQALANGPGACAVRGFGSILGVALIAAVFHAAGPLRLISAGLWCILVCAAAVGSGGVVSLMADRIGGMGTVMTPFARLTRASILYSGAGLVPIVGWFLITPIAAMATVGAGIAALRRPKPAHAASPQLPSSPTEVLG